MLVSTLTTSEEKRRLVSVLCGGDSYLNEPIKYCNTRRVYKFLEVQLCKSLTRSFQLLVPLLVKSNLVRQSLKTNTEENRKSVNIALKGPVGLAPRYPLLEGVRPAVQVARPALRMTLLCKGKNQ